MGHPARVDIAEWRPCPPPVEGKLTFRFGTVTMEYFELRESSLGPPRMYRCRRTEKKDDPKAWEEHIPLSLK